MSEKPKKSSDKALNEPSNTHNPSSHESKGEGVVTLSPSENTNKEKSEGSEAVEVKGLTPNNLPLDVLDPTSQDIEIEARELYQINNFIR